MSAPTPLRLLVAGGSGFLGTRILASATARAGWTVTSISRSGEPSDWSVVSSSSTTPPWAKSVNWVKADILNPATYRQYLKDADAVVHSMGILLEADYKGVLTGTESPVAGLRRAFSPTKEGSVRDPSEKGEKDERLDAGEKDGQLTYELMNRDSAIALASEAQAAGVKTFVFISAAAGAPMLPKRYITTKRQAEDTIATKMVRMRNIFIRPGFLYDSSRKFTLPIAVSGMVGNTMNDLLGGRLTSLFGAAVEKPLKVDFVADAVVEAIGDESVKGVQDTKGIEALNAKAWRRGML